MKENNASAKHIISVMTLPIDAPQKKSLITPSSFKNISVGDLYIFSDLYLLGVFPENK